MVIIHKESNAILKIKKILAIEKPISILLIRGGKSYKNCGAKEAIEPQLSGYNIINISGFSNYPSKQDIKKTRRIIRKNNIDFIIAVGGGSVLDVGKAASVLHDEQKPIEDYITGKRKPKGKNIKRLLIPTTAGPGAEITPYSAVYIGKKKYSLAHPSMVPDYVILAPELTYCMSPKLTAQTGVDALANIIEGFWSAKATEESKKYSRMAFPLIFDNLAKAVNNPNAENRRAMLIGAHLAGKSVSISRTTAAHALSYPLTAYHNIPHGHAVMLTLPYFFMINEKATKENIQEGLTLGYIKKTFNELLSLLNVKSGSEAKDKLIALMDAIHLERKLSYFGIKEKNLKKIIDDGFNPQRVVNNPVKVTRDMEFTILTNLL